LELVQPYNVEVEQNILNGFKANVVYFGHLKKKISDEDVEE